MMGKYGKYTYCIYLHRNLWPKMVMKANVLSLILHASLSKNLSFQWLLNVGILYFSKRRSFEEKTTLISWKNTLEFHN
jgi:hypothetical protein